ncbi:MAG TPA: hypothetical protein VKF38_14305 [Anaerolineaceae bacterium]|nr:hypothetical protein [Anaerolineaceae bacterium]
MSFGKAIQRLRAVGRNTGNGKAATGISCHIGESVSAVAPQQGFSALKDDDPVAAGAQLVEKCGNLGESGFQAGTVNEGTLLAM